MRIVFSFIYQWFIFVPVLILTTILTAIVVMVGCTFGKHKFWGYVPPKYWSKITCRMALCRIKTQANPNIDPNQSYVFIANHQGAFDIFLTYGYLNQNIKWVQKAELRKIPFVGKASEIAGHVFVDNSSSKAMLHTITKAKEELAEGVSMVIFPEGARTCTSKMGKFKRGAFIIATQMQLPIVPITINGPYNVLKRNSMMMHFGKKMEITVHDPIETKGLTADNIPQLMEQSLSAVKSGLWDEFK